MIGSFISRFLILVLGYAYSAYKCYKTVQLNKPEIEQLRFWCQYWILVALLAMVERFADIFFSWLPLYCEAKLGFYLYLWYPNTSGATYVYETYFGPYIAKHESEIDRNLLEMRARPADLVQLSLQTTASYLQTRFSEVLKYAIVVVQAPQLHSFQRHRCKFSSRRNSSYLLHLLINLQHLGKLLKKQVLQLIPPRSCHKNKWKWHPVLYSPLHFQPRPAN